MAAAVVTVTTNLPRRHHKHYPKISFPFLTNSNLTFPLSGIASPVAMPISTIPPHLPDPSPFESHLIPIKRTERASSFPIALHRDPLATRAATIPAISAQFQIGFFVLV
ncbi:unnamed protein product [Linum trigynum]|uniref:Uncharacterized protein n=1 Tax=Linum trigynum TaxID=586398 RepID=A0AAV2G113_9ROSI